MSFSLMLWSSMIHATMQQRRKRMAYTTRVDVEFVQDGQDRQHNPNADVPQQQAIWVRARKEFEAKPRGTERD